MWLEKLSEKMKGLRKRQCLKFSPELSRRRRSSRKPREWNNICMCIIYYIENNGINKYKMYILCYLRIQLISTEIIIVSLFICIFLLSMNPSIPFLLSNF